MPFVNEEKGERGVRRAGRAHLHPWDANQGPSSPPARSPPGASHSSPAHGHLSDTAARASARRPSHLVPTKAVKLEPNQEITRLWERPHPVPGTTHSQGVETSPPFAQRQRRAPHSAGLDAHVGHRLNQTGAILGEFQHSLAWQGEARLLLRTLRF